MLTPLAYQRHAPARGRQPPLRTIFRPAVKGRFPTSTTGDGITQILFCDDAPSIIREFSKNRNYGIAHHLLRQKNVMQLIKFELHEPRFAQYCAFTLNATAGMRGNFRNNLLSNLLSFSCSSKQLLNEHRKKDDSL